ncbi:hypothetical protein MKX01_008204 [Papaver californicum]|nr:hypothetical protein MKX01_008204 [Papaver californicum]
MEFCSLPLSPTHRGKLISAGYTTFSFFSLSSSPYLNVSHEEAIGILKIALKNGKLGESNSIHSVVTGAQSAWDMLRGEDMFRRITTSCGDLGNILGGGISCKEVTEITISCRIQLAVDVQIPVGYGGLGGKAVYIDTEGSFMVERVYQVAEACIANIMENHVPQRKDAQVCQKTVHYTEQIAVINYLDKFIEEHKDVKIVIIDSVTFHFRRDFDDWAQRTRILSTMALKLMKIAKKFGLAVVLLNQVTNKVVEGSFQLSLALGDSWSHGCTNRVILYWNGNQRYAYIDKSPSLRSASAPYSVTGKGIRDSTSQCKRIRMM